MNTPVRTSTTRVSADGLTQSQRLFRRQIGLTLVEMMVAMAISLLIVLAAVSALIVTRQGFTSVDASSQLRDNARFSADLVQRLGVQAGYQDDVFASKKASTTEKAIRATKTRAVMMHSPSVREKRKPVSCSCLTGDQGASRCTCWPIQGKNRQKSRRR